MKKRTPFKNANMLLPALFVLALLCAFLASCENLLQGGDDNALVGGGMRSPTVRAPAR